MSTFMCEACGGTFTQGWTDEEAKAEATSTFTEAELSDTAVVCEDCWLAMRLALPEMDTRYVQ